MRAYLVRWCVAQGKMGRVPQARARYTASQPSNPPKSRDTGLNRARALHALARDTGTHARSKRDRVLRATIRDASAPAPLTERGHVVGR